VTVAPGSIVTWLAVRSALLTRGVGPGTFLDVGCGEGWMTKKVTSLGMRGVALEPSEIAFRRAASGSHLSDVHEVELLNLALNEFERLDKFDLGCAFTVIEHVADDVSFLKELTKYVRRGGWLVITVPAGEDRWTTEDDLVGHLRRYSHDSLKAVMESAGLARNLQVTGIGFPFMNMTELIRNKLLERRAIGATDHSTFDKTSASGVWKTKWLNTFPRILGLLFNAISLKPVYWVGSLFRKSPRCVLLLAIAQVE